MVYVLLALGAALCTSLTNIFAKIGIGKNVNSNFATMFRTFIVILMSLIVCVISGSITKFPVFTWKNYLFLRISGICTGCSWLCYYKALKLGNINKVAPIDKSSFVLTSILFLIFFYNDTTKNGNPLTICMLVLSMILMLVGTFLMIEKKDVTKDKESKMWLIFAILSAIFASLVSLFIKLGLKDTPSDLGTFIRTCVVFVFASLIVIFRKDYKGVKEISWKSWLFLALSGIATGGAWLLEYEALVVTNSNPVVVNSIGKLSILLTMLFSWLILKEKFTIKMLIGLAILTSGIVLIIIFGL